jgi:hypothetical protein
MTSFRSRLTGTWDLISYAAISLTSPKDVVYPLGSDCVGRAIFSADGYVSAYIQAADIAPYSSGREFSATQAELAAAAKKTVSYTAPFYLDEVEGSMKQRIEYDVQMSLPPNWKGGMEVRLLEMWEDEGELFLSLAPDRNVKIGGVERVVKIVSRKARDNFSGQLRGGWQGRTDARL